jgi:hypothetical protein
MVSGHMYVELTQTDYIERMHSEVNRFMKDKYTVKSPITKESINLLR